MRKFQGLTGMAFRVDKGDLWEGDGANRVTEYYEFIWFQ